jgi:hypothetical protein
MPKEFIYEFFSDYLDEATRMRMGHDNWGLLAKDEIKVVEAITGTNLEEVILIHKEPDEEDNS